MFNKNYPFFTGSSEYRKVILKIMQFAKKYLKTNSKIIEIGSNDGTFLKNFLGTDHKILGIEPSKSVADVSIKNNIPTMNNFFNTSNTKN